MCGSEQPAAIPSTAEAGADLFDLGGGEAFRGHALSGHRRKGVGGGLNLASWETRGSSETNIDMCV